MSDRHQEVQKQKPRPRWTGAAIALVSIGLLMLIPSGLCTGIIGLSALFDSSGGYDSGLLRIALLIGGPFVVLGALLVRTGLRERHRG